MSLGGFSHLSVARKVILTAALMTTLILVSLVGISITQASKLAIATGEAGFSTLTRLIANNAAGGIRWNKPDAIESAYNELATADKTEERRGGDEGVRKCGIRCEAAK